MRDYIFVKNKGLHKKSLMLSPDNIRNLLKFQFDISWQLLEYHINEIDNEECLWRPREKGLHMHNEDGIWYADWLDSESYDIDPASIDWLAWQITFWWLMVLNYSIA